MYAVSAAYRAAMNNAIQRHRISGTIDGVPFGMDDILRDSMTVSNQCSDSKDLTLGGVYIGVLKFTLLKDLGIRRGTWKDRRINLTFELLTNHRTDTWEPVPVGIYTIAEANHTERGIELTCYDNMSKLDKEYPMTGTNGSIYDVMRLACLEAGVQFGMTKAECEALPNGTVTLGIYPDNGCKTWRDVVHYLAQLVGGFATVNRQGQIVLRRFGNQTGFTIDSSRRLTGSKFSDFITNYTGLSVVNMAEKSTRYVHMPQDNGITINLGSNPFIQYGTEETITAVLETILREANAVKYTPFNSAMVGNPAFDLGDIITYTNGVAGVSSTCCLMSYTWKFNNSYSVQGFGKNPSLATAQSKAEKDISGLGQQSKADVMQYFTYENSQEFEIGNIRQNIAELRVTNTKDTFVEFWIELKMQVDLDTPEEPAVLNFTYTYDDVVEVYHPVMTYNHDGVYILGLHYFKRMSTVLQHSFKVFLEVNGGTVKIDLSNIHAVIKGQGLAEVKGWDGTLTFNDVFALPLGRAMQIMFNDNSVDVSTQIPEAIQIVDAFSLDLARNYEFNYEDKITITTQTGVFGLVTQDGRPLITQDGRPYQTGGKDNG